MADERIEVDVVVNAENVEQLNSVTTGLNNLGNTASSIGGRMSNGTNSIRNFVNGFVSAGRGILEVNDSINQVSRRMRTGLSGIHNMWVSGLRTTVREVKNLTKEAIENYTELTQQHAKTTGVLANSGSYNLKTDKGKVQFQQDSEALKQQTIRLARTGTTGSGSLYTAEDISEAQTELVKAGVPSKAILNDGVLETILTFAQANDVNTANAVTFATALGSQFKVDYKDWGEMLDKVSHTADLSPIGVNDVVQSMKYAGGISSGLGRSMEEVLGQVAMMGDFGLKASQAGSAIQALYSRILTGDTTVITDKQAEVAPPNALKAFYDFSKYAKSDGSGLTYDQIKNADSYEKLGEISGNLRPMEEIVDQLDEVISTMNDEEQAWFIKKFFGLYQMKGAYALMSDEGEKSLLDYEKDIAENSDGTNENKLQQLLDSDYGKQETLSNLIDVTKTDIGERLSPLVNQIRTELFNFVNNKGNYDIDFDAIRNALDECSDAIAEQYGDAIGNIANNIGNTVIDLTEVGAEIAPELAGGIANIISEISDGDIFGAIEEWNTMISSMNTSATGLPENLQGLADKVIGLIDVFGKLVAMDIGSRVLETITNVVKIIQIAGGAVIRAGSVIVNGNYPGGTPIPQQTTGTAGSRNTNTASTIAGTGAGTVAANTRQQTMAANEREIRRQPVVGGNETDGTTIVNIDGSDVTRTQDPNAIARHMNNPRISETAEDNAGFRTVSIVEDPVIDGDLERLNRTEITNKDGKWYKTTNTRQNINNRTGMHETTVTEMRSDTDDIVRTNLISSDRQSDIQPRITTDILTGREREEALRNTHIADGFDEISHTDRTAQSTDTNQRRTSEQPEITDDTTVTRNRNVDTETHARTDIDTPNVKLSQTKGGMMLRNTAGFAGSIGGGYFGTQIGTKLGKEFSNYFGTDEMVSEMIGGMTGGIGGGYLGARVTNKAVEIAIDASAAAITKAGSTRAGQLASRAMNSSAAGALGKAVPFIGDIGFGAYYGYKDWKNAEDDNDRIHAITDNAGGALGGIAGGVAGGALGSAIAGGVAGAVGGTVVPVLGNIVGALGGIGVGIAGYYGGTKAGEYVGDELSGYDTDYDELVKYIDEQRASSKDTESKYAYKGNYNLASINYGDILSKVDNKDNEYNEDVKWYVPWSWNNNKQRSDAESEAVDQFDKKYEVNMKSAEIFYGVQELLHNLTGVKLEYDDYNNNAYKFRKYYEDYQENPDGVKLSDYDIDSEVLEKFTIASESWASTFIDQVNENIKLRNQEIDAGYVANANNDGKTGVLDTQLPALFSSHYDQIDTTPEKFNQNVTQGIFAFKDPTSALTANIQEFMNSKISTSSNNKLGIETLFPLFESLNGIANGILTTTNNIFSKDTTQKDGAEAQFGNRIGEVLSRQTSIENKINSLTSDKKTQAQLGEGVFAFKDPTQGLANNLREFISGYESKSSVNQLQPQLESINGTADAILGKIQEQKTEQQPISDILAGLKSDAETEHVVENTLEQTIQINDQSHINIQPITTPITVQPNISITAHVDQSGNVQMTQSQQNTLFSMMTQFNVNKSRNYNVKK